MQRYRTRTPATRQSRILLRFLCAAIGLIWASNFILVRFLALPGSSGQQYYDNTSSPLRVGSRQRSSKLQNWSPSSYSTGVANEDKNSRRRTPVVIVPGSMGSILQARIEKNKRVSASSFCSSSWNSWYNLWLSEWALTFSSCFFENIKMQYLGK